MKIRKSALGLVLVLVIVAVTVLTVRLVTVNAKSSDVELYKYYTSYEIQPGDTLYAIAEKYTEGTDVSIEDYIDEVKDNNKMSDDKIVSGMYIIISYYSEEYK